MKSADRPLSPHLGVYRPQITSVLSITHRVTGLVLSASLLLLVYWLWGVASGPEAYASAQAVLGSFLGRMVLFGGTVALFFHLCNGIRHLFWDAGRGFEMRAVYTSGRAVIIASVVLSVVTWALGYAMRGGA